MICRKPLAGADDIWHACVSGALLRPHNTTRPRAGFFMPARSAKWTPETIYRWSYRNPKSCTPLSSRHLFAITSETTAGCTTHRGITPH
jgi:hypothetical protein